MRVSSVVANPSDHGLRLEFIVDTGVIYTVIPKSVAEGLRLKEKGSLTIFYGFVMSYKLGL